MTHVELVPMKVLVVVITTTVVTFYIVKGLFRYLSSCIFSVVKVHAYLGGFTGLILVTDRENEFPSQLLNHKKTYYPS